MNKQELVGIVKQTADHLSLGEYKNFIDQKLLNNLKSDLHNFNTAYEQIMQEDRVLRIGIVGGVKAGKSTFLNSLIFNGESILPKAPTPMTAALTKMSYAETPEATIHFFSTEEWKLIEQDAAKYDEQWEQFKREKQKEERNERFKRKAMKDNKREHIEKVSSFLGDAEERWIEMFNQRVDERLKNAKELIALAADKGVDDSKLGTTETLEDTNRSGLMKQLENYVGSQGRYTPIVKHTELQLNEPSLQGLEIVDTPGLNDPIASRSKKTEDFLMECDVVFFLSYTGSFLPSTDMDVLSRTLPEKSVGHIQLVGSKLDSGMLDFRGGRRSKVDFEEVYRKSIEVYNKTAIKNFRAYHEGRTVSRSVKRLTEAKPHYVSSIFFEIAQALEKNEPLNEEQKHIFDLYQNRFERADFPIDVSFFKKYAGIDTIRKVVFGRIMEEKERIIKSKQETFLEEQREHFRQGFTRLLKELKEEEEQLQSGDLEEMRANLQRLAIQKEELTTLLQYEADYLSAELAGVIKEKTNAAIQSDYEMPTVNVLTKEKSYTTTTGVLLWKKEHYHTDRVKYASTTEVGRELEGFVAKLNKTRQDELRLNLSQRQRKNNFFIKVFNVFEESGLDFRRSLVERPIDTLFQEIQNNSKSLEADLYYRKLVEKVPATVVEDEEINELERALLEVVQSCRNDLGTLGQEEIVEMEEKITVWKERFVKELVDRMEVDVKKQEELMLNQEENIQTFATLEETIRQTIEKL